MWGEIKEEVTVVVLNHMLHYGAAGRSKETGTGYCARSQDVPAALILTQEISLIPLHFADD